MEEESLPLLHMKLKSLSIILLLDAAASVNGRWHHLNIWWQRAPLPVLPIQGMAEACKLPHWLLESHVHVFEVTF